MRVVFGVEERGRPRGAAAAARDRASAIRRSARSFASRAGRPERNRKVANLIQLLAGGSAELLLLTDADVRVPPDYVARMTPAFKDGEVGLRDGALPERPGAERREPARRARHEHPLPAEHVRSPRASRACTSRSARASPCAARRSSARRLRAAAPRSPPTTTASRSESRPRAIALAWAPVVVEHVLEDEGWRARAAPPAPLVARGAELRPLGYLGQLARARRAPGAARSPPWRSRGGPGLARARRALPLGWWGAQLAHLWRRRALLALRPLDLALAPLVDLLAVAIWAGGLVGSPEPPRA